MDLRISLTDDICSDQTGLESLLDWLLSEPQLAGLVAREQVRPARGQMGALPEALVVSASSLGSGAVTVLALALKAWLSQPRHSNIKIRIEGEDGKIRYITADYINRNDAADVIREAIKGKPVDTEDADT